jgi:hypothetical protein
MLLARFVPDRISTEFGRSRDSSATLREPARDEGARAGAHGVERRLGAEVGLAPVVRPVGQDDLEEIAASAAAGTNA